jgi:hypothetical protein
MKKAWIAYAIYSAIMGLCALVGGVSFIAAIAAVAIPFLFLQGIKEASRIDAAEEAREQENIRTAIAANPGPSAG